MSPSRLLITVFLFFFSHPAKALNLTEVYVYGEKDNEEIRQCSLRNASAQAAVNAALSYNRVRATDNNYGAHLYINLNALAVGSGCVVNVDLQATVFTKISNSNLTDKPFLGGPYYVI